MDIRQMQRTGSLRSGEPRHYAAWRMADMPQLEPVDPVLRVLRRRGLEARAVSRFGVAVRELWEAFRKV